MNDHPRSGGASQYRVLLVDDDPWMLRIMKAALSPSTGVVTATSGEQALRLLETEDFDVVCSDLVMPGMSGTDLLRAVAEDHEATGRLLVTAATDGHEPDEPADYDVLLKPFDPERFADLVDHLASEARERATEDALVALPRARGRLPRLGHGGAR